MNINQIEFDDVRTSEEYGIWTNVCKKCTKKYNLTISDEIPISGVICGLKGCNNEAFYYLDFEVNPHLINNKT